MRAPKWTWIGDDRTGLRLNPCGAYLAILLFACGGIQAQGPCETEPAPASGTNGSDFCAVLNVQHGRLKVIYEQSRFHASASSGYKTTEEPALRRKFTDMTNALLQKDPKLYQFGLRNTETALEQNHKLPPEAIAAVVDLTVDTWAKAKAALDAWSRCPEKAAGAVCSRNNGASAFQTAIKTLGGQQLSTDTPFSNPRGTGSQGVAHIQVDDRVPDLSQAGAVEIRFDDGATPSGTKGRIYDGALIAKWLNRAYRGDFWISSNISMRLRDVFAGLGMMPEIIPSQAGNPRTLTICESYTVGRIQLPAATGDSRQDREELSRILYNVLNHEDYQRDWFTAIDAPGGPLRVLDYRKLRGDGSQLEYLDVYRLADQQAALQPLGYGISTQSSPSAAGASKCPPLDLAVTVLAASSQPDNTETPAASPAVPPATSPDAEGDEDGSGPPRPAPEVKPKPAPVVPQSASAAAKAKTTRLAAAQNLQPLQAQELVPAPAPAGGQPAASSDKPSITYGGGVEYRPGQGLRPVGSVDLPYWSTSLGLINLSATGGVDGTHPLGTAAFHIDYLGFRALHHRRSSFDFTGGTDTTAKRLLGGQATDERRTGGTARLEYDPLREAGTVSVTTFLEGESHRVALSRSGVDVGALRLNAINGGGAITVSRATRQYATLLTIEPSVHGGIGAAAGVPLFTVAALDLRLHQRLSDFRTISLDVAAHFRQATSQTPLVELPSLGGSENLRGFRQDDALGRRLWSVQSELWIPVPGTSSAPNGVLRFLRQNIRLAALGDFGGMYQTRTAVPAYYDAARYGFDPAGMRAGAGAGIRYIRGNAAIKLDWAHGFGDARSGSGRDRFYLSVATTRSF